MQGVWLEQGALHVRDDLDPPEPDPGEALVRVTVAGICGTDLELTRGYAAFSGVPGHEFVGVVASAPGSEEWHGRRVVGEINVCCGRCRECSGGRCSHCERRTVVGIRGRPGAFAEWLAVPVANLHEVPPVLSDEEAVFTEPLAAALRVQQQVRLEPGMRVVVVGAGRLGQLVARTLALTGCELLVAARSEPAAARLERLGIRTMAPSELPARSADVAVDCTGDPEGFGIARRALRPGGTLVLKSTHADTTPVDLSPLVVDEITVVGSRCGPFDAALGLLASGRLPVSDLVEADHPLEAAEAAFAHAARPGALKVFLRPGRGGPPPEAPGTARG